MHELQLVLAHASSKGAHVTATHGQRDLLQFADKTTDTAHEQPRVDTEEIKIFCAQAQNAELIPIPQSILDGAVASMKKVTNGAGAGIAWPALLRKLDRVNPGYDA